MQNMNKTGKLSK